MPLEVSRQVLPEVHGGWCLCRCKYVGNSRGVEVGASVGVSRKVPLLV